MSPPDGLMYILRGKNTSYYPLAILKALILLRLRKIVTNISDTRPTLSWILYTFAVLLNFARLAESLRTFRPSRANWKGKGKLEPQVDGGSNNKDNSVTLPPSNDLSIINQTIWNVIWPPMAATPRPPTDIERRIYKIKRDINSSAIGHFDRAVDRMAVAFSPNTRFAHLDFNGPAATSALSPYIGDQIMQYHANSNIQNLPCSTPVPALHMHPENRHIFRYFVGIPGSTKDENYPMSIYNIRTEFTPYPPSVGLNLQPTTTSSLTLNKRRLGYCLVVKAVLPPKHLDATHVLIEDEDGKWEILHVFNFPGINHAEDRIGQGQLMIIKEPLYYTGYGGLQAIRVDHPSDITYIMYDHPFVPLKWKRQDAHGLDAEPKILKMDGEVRMRWRKYHQAIDCFTLAYNILDRTQQEMQKNFSRPSSSGAYNTSRLEAIKLRVGCHFYLKQWERCLIEANSVLNLSFNEKTAWYKANALFHLNSFEESKQVILRIMGGSRYKFKECSRLHSQIRTRQSNSMGQYNMTQILERGKEGQHEICAGDFISEVRVKKSLSIGGHGIFTQRDFKPGDLVMVVKAVATVYGEKNTALQVRSQEGQYIKTKYGQAMVAQTISRMTGEPKNIGHLIQKLNRGKYNGTFFKSNGEYLVNGFWIDDTIEKCSMQHSIYNKRIPDFGSILDPEIFPDMALSVQSPSPTSSVRLAPGTGSSITIDSLVDSEGILRGPSSAEQASFFPQAAFINHSCLPNVRISIFSDLLFVHAASYIPKDEEIFINYLDDDYSPLTPRREILEEMFGFSCRCVRCELEYSNIEYWNTRKKAHDTIGELLSGDSINSASAIFSGVSHFIKVLEDGFKDSPSDLPQFDTAWALMVEEYFRRGMDYDEKRTGRTAELRNMKLALQILQALGAEYEFIEGDVKIFRYGFICKWLVEAWILAAISSARFYGGVFWTLRVVAKEVYGILCGETVTFEKLFWGRLEEAEVAELTEAEMLSMADIVKWLENEKLDKTELGG
ncbi:hypothetical protein TWF718_009180 [Orbilia javanica]|uniref:SET domain-containing protein n=1 Tax=Orbilia javanica TaxID=47235 RepID=A0AAN8RBI9_9PEZI